MKKTLTYLSLFIPAIVIVAFFLTQDLINKAESSASDNTSGWAWSENIGWISTNCTDDGCTAGSDYGVNVSSATQDVTGNMWSENIGWISFDRSVTNNPPEEPYKSTLGAIAKYNPVTKTVDGWARAVAGCQDDPNVVATVCSSSNAGLASLDWDGWIKLQNVTYNDSTKKLDGWAWGGEVVGWVDFSLNPLVPSGSITASTCQIPKGGSSCNSTVTWTSQYFLGGTSVLQGVTQFSTVTSDTQSRLVKPGDATFVIKDLGGTFSFQTTATVSCEPGSGWDATLGTCEDVILPPTPTINISASPTVIRKGQTADIEVTVDSNQQLTCTMYGADPSPQTFTHNGPSTQIFTYTDFATKKLYSTQVVKVKCVVDSEPTVIGEGELRINVVSTGGEI